MVQSATPGLSGCSGRAQPTAASLQEAPPHAPASRFSAPWRDPLAQPGTCPLWPGALYTLEKQLSHVVTQSEGSSNPGAGSVPLEATAASPGLCTSLCLP